VLTELISSQIVGKQEVIPSLRSLLHEVPGKGFLSNWPGLPLRTKATYRKCDFSGTIGELLPHQLYFSLV
jgi:hypothetical protein